jgi:hypothetical protein
MTVQTTKAKHVCAEVPEFERLNYFYGQMLSAADFRSEQSYLREKLKLHNRCLHGYGVICGLEVTPVHEESCCPPTDKEEIDNAKKELAKVETEIQSIQKQMEDANLAPDKRAELQKDLEKYTAWREELRRKLRCKPSHKPDGSKSCDHESKPSAKVVVQCGFALDCHGNELVLRQPVLVDLWSALKLSEQQILKEGGKGVIYMSICYCAEPTHPSRPVLPDTCGAVSDCNYGKYRDSVRFRVSSEKPVDDERCEPCCAPCTDQCVLLAKIWWEAVCQIDEDDIDNSVRRAIGLYEPTVITGVSWQHGKTYSPAEAKSVLGTATDMGRTNGIEVTFSRPVYAETLTRGVVDLWRVHGGRGLRGMISAIEGDYVNKRASGLITSFEYRDESGETLNDGDRVIVIIRGDFILDKCCRPVDGNHVGGRVPQLAAYQPQPGGPAARQAAYARDQRAQDAKQDGEDGHEDKDRHDTDECNGLAPCVLPPGGLGPWTSGNGTAGGTLESWFFIDSSQEN